MDFRNFELAAEFCRLVATTDLLAYLGLPEQAGPSEARQKLKARRKYMQGMQGNPKYKQEALYLIKHFGALDAALGDTAAYLADARRRAESIHLPILEMTVRGVLAGGSLSLDQEQYLRRNATELGISERTTEDLLDRLTKESGIQRPAEVRVADATTPPHGFEALDEASSVRQQASPQEIETAWRHTQQQLGSLPDSAHRDTLQDRADLALNVLRDHAGREQYDVTSSRTGPPARTRTVRPELAATAPPVKHRMGAPTATTPSHLPGSERGQQPAPLEVVGGAQRSVRVYGSPYVELLLLRNTADAPVSGTLEVDVPWLRVTPDSLDPAHREHRIEVRIDPSALTGDSDTGSVRVLVDHGLHIDVAFTAQRSDPRLPMAAAFGALLTGAALLLVAGILVFRTLGPGSSGLTIQIDPAAMDIRLDGVQVGSGSRVHIDEPPLGQVTLTVSQPNFAPYTQELALERGRARVVDVHLELIQPMDFSPSPKLTKGQVDQDTARQVVGARGAAFDECIRRVAAVGQVLTGTVRVHLAKDGRAAGLEVQGAHIEDPEVRACLTRQAAAITFAPLERGDYATVRYDYTVTADAAAGTPR